MINPNELRTGNVIIIDDKHTSKVISIDAERSIVRTENPRNKYSDGSTGDEFYLTSSYISGIALTSEWLGKCGFVKSHPDSIGDLELCMPYDNELEYCYNDGLITFNGMCLPASPKYVHQLQNLYFALTGEELEIKL